MPTAVEVIRAKRDGGVLSDEQIRWFIDAYTRDEVAHEQASALLMAIFLHGLNAQELGVWTDAMIASGIRLDLSSVPMPTVDKHSTGGVGDKISLPLCPLVAACGVAVPQLSGRGLGHTGGTLDKLESIPGIRTDLDQDAFVRQLSDVGTVIAATNPASPGVSQVIAAPRASACNQAAACRSPNRFAPPSSQCPAARPGGAPDGQ